MKKCILFAVWAFSAFLTADVAQAVPFDIPADFETVCENDSTQYCIQLREPLGGIKIEGEDDSRRSVQSIRGKTGLDIVGYYIAILYQYGAALIGIICVLVIVVSGVQIIAGGANSEMVTQAKGRIMQALFSLALLFLSAVILKTVNPGFFDWTQNATKQETPN